MNPKRGDAFTKALRRKILNVDREIAVLKRKMRANPEFADQIYQPKIRAFNTELRMLNDILKLYVETEIK